METQAVSQFQIARGTLRAYLGMFLALVVAAGIGYFLADNHIKQTPLPLAQTPIISEDARNDYEKGFISRNTAKSRIDAHLVELEDTENITGWEYDENLSQYTVTLNGGGKFRYILH